MRAAVSHAAATAAFLGAAVEKEFAEGRFQGEVVAVRHNVQDDKDKAKKWPVLFRIRYSDGDKEDITLQELLSVLLDRPAAEARLAAAQQQEQQGPDSNDENEAAALMPPPQPKRRRAPGVLGDATERSRNAAPGEERRSRREVKRRKDEEYEYDEPRGAKRAAAGEGGAAPRPRFGIRAPAAPAAQAGAGDGSESQEPYPVTEDGMRTTGLPGHPVEIEVFNFMCHEHFKMQFGQHVNFISGTNGSGKSAVLQAVQCCLGVKASDTGRANSFRKLIKTGADEAIIRITVANRPYKGFDAFRHGVFGDTITVERKIAASGASSYALKDASGRVHARKREDLDAMLQTLGLNAANPVCVMTQDTARNFLAGSSTKSDQEKFQLYIEATGLDQIAYNLEVSRAQIRLMDEAVQQIQEEYSKMKEEHGQLKRSIEGLREIQHWRDEAAQLDKVLAWAMAEEAEAVVAQLEAALAGAPARLAAAEAAAEALRQEHAALKEGVDGKAHFLATYQQRAAAMAAELDGLKQAHKEAHKAAKGVEAKMRQLRQALQEEQARKETLEAAVREVKDELEQGTQAAVAQYQAAVGDAQAAANAADEEVRGYADAHAAAAQAAKAAVERAEGIRREVWAADEAIKGLRAQIQGIKEAGRSKLAAFGGLPMVQLAAAVKRQERAFSRPPIGPVGQHLTLQDTRWGMAVEAALGFNLDAFVVHSMEDSHLLRRLINQHFSGAKFKPQVFVVNFDLPLHTIPAAAQPPPALPTIYRLLSVGDKKLAAPILNNLVDTAHIERIAVAASNADCAAAGWSTPNVMACFGANGSKYYRRGQTQTSIPPPHWLRTARLGHSSAEQTSELEAEVARKEAELQHLKQAYAAAQREMQAADQEERTQRQGLAGAKQRQWAAGTALTQLTQAPPAELTATQGDGEGEDAAQQEIWQATQACIDLEQQLRERQGALGEAQAAERAAHEAYEAKRAEVSRLSDENDAFLATYHQEQQAADEKQAEVADAEEEAQELRARAAQQAAELAAARAEQAEIRANAEQVCPREEAAAARAAFEAQLRAKPNLTEEDIAKLMSPLFVDKKIKALERKVAEAEREAGGNLDELEAKFAASQARMSRDGARFQQAIATFQMIDEAYKLRKRKLKELDQNLERIVNQRFLHYMARKGHLGSIKLDRKARTLQLKVQVGGKGAGAEPSAVKDLKQLSGGERSYTTVAFTLALGGQTEMPFRALDEFDVFMDAINRRVAMQNLFSFARENPELQFIFLTPQDIAAVEDARQACAGSGQPIPEGFVKVVQMRPARANATRA